ncbi:hypothetical protein Sste5346_009092 [Sporothrix stenoceras]|uniref:Beta-xylosidase C-terminal Concanavalin A-like domain-containing protein n=1 Tax=Sporothrix stenoceras TaxID=5173 RepID=A0ABR3YP25_9PEZI
MPKRGHDLDVPTHYIATSTFKWFPGVQIYHSRNLADWALVARPLDRKSQLDMLGHPDGGLVYTDVPRKEGSFKDTHNFIVTAPAITGPWSDPIYLNSSGFDPSLFHDGDGRKWLVNMLWDHRRRPQLFAGIALQEFDVASGTLVGPRKNIFQGTDTQYTEGPHLYKRNGRYYLLTAEGGTQYNHTCTLARSRDLAGLYEVHPQKHILTSKDAPFSVLQRAGHGDLVDSSDGQTTYLVHLTGRPITQRRRCILGRETAIQEAYWGADNWLYVKGGPVPSLYVELPSARDEAAYWATQHYSFGASDGDSYKLDPDFQWLRTPEPERIFRVNESGLVLICRESIGSWREQALVARRQVYFSYRAETIVSFRPMDERHYAGLTAYYSQFKFFYLTVTADTVGQRELLIMSSQASFPYGDLDLQYLQERVQVPNEGKIRLALTIRGDQFQFYYAMEGNTDMTKVGPVFDASILSDECGGPGSFTGAFVGMACSDLNGTALPATFEYFTYEPLRDKSDRYEI